jgi:hypothetical protein
VAKHSLGHRVGPLRRMNCLVGAFLLVVTGRVRRLYVSRRHCPFHIYLRTRRGNIVHFTNRLETAPFVYGKGLFKQWFHGRFEVLPRRVARVVWRNR